MPEIKYRFEKDGEQHTDTFTTDDVSDRRAGWNPDVALAYAQHLAVDRHGSAPTPGDGIDVNTVEIVRLAEPSDQYDETGGISL